MWPVAVSARGASQFPVFAVLAALLAVISLDNAVWSNLDHVKSYGPLRDWSGTGWKVHQMFPAIRGDGLGVVMDELRRAAGATGGDGGRGAPGGTHAPTAIDGAINGARRRGDARRVRRGRHNRHGGDRSMDARGLPSRAWR